MLPVCFRQVIAPAATVTKSLIYWWAHKDSNLGPADCKLAAPQKCRAFWGLWMVKGKPGSACGICVHPQRHLIELAMMHRVPVRVLARRFPDVGHDCFFRHRRNHMPPQLKAALLAAVHPTEVDLEQLERSESEGLLGSLVSQRAASRSRHDIEMSQIGVRVSACQLHRGRTSVVKARSIIVVGKTLSSGSMKASSYSSE
jgi:hypothetical protein